MSNGTPDISLASLATASPEQIKAMIGMLPPQFLSNVRAALSEEKVEQSEQTEPLPSSVSTPVEEQTEEQAKTEQPPPPFPSAATTTETQVQPQDMFETRPPLHFERLSPDYSLYDPFRCRGRVILGVPITSMELPKQESAGRALVIRLLHPTLVVDNIGRLMEARVGQDILLEVSHWLRALVRRAHDEKHVGEVWLRPGEFRKSEIWHGRLFPRDQFLKGGG
jgi:hypothetical protein